jgi:hypothetical protein
MNFEFAQQINPFLEHLDFAKALEIAESSLNKIPSTEFHFFTGKPLISQTNSLTAWIDDFYKKTAKKISNKAMYFEMIEFDINFKIWDIDGFAYNIDGGLDLDDMEWLVNFTRETTTSQGFVLEGYEKLQEAFANIELTSKNLQDSRDWCEQIIIARYMELMRAAHVNAKEKNLAWAKIPIYFTEHAYDFIVKSTN